MENRCAITRARKSVRGVACFQGKGSVPHKNVRTSSKGSISNDMESRNTTSRMGFYWVYNRTGCKMTLNCNHDCTNCPACTLGGETSCKIINKVLAKLEYDKRISEQKWHNLLREGDKNDKNDKNI